MSKRKQRGDVAWFVPGRKTPILFSTTATSELLNILFEQYNDLREVYEHIHYDEEAKKIVKSLLDRGITTVRKTV